MKFHKITLGWWNLLKYKLGYISPELHELSVKRLTTCFQCPHLTRHKTCGLCGCVVSAKSLVYTETCPDNRWVPVYYYEGLLGDTVIICEEVPPLLRGLLYEWLENKPENITVEKWKEFLNNF